MVRCARGLRAVLALVLALLAFPSSDAVASSCQFVLGFQAFHDRIPAVVGNCMADEQRDPRTGDAFQATTGPNGRGGLLVWRQSDHRVAFTDGDRTWVDGPAGIQERLNTRRFAWEDAPTDPAPRRVFFGVNLHPLQDIYAVYSPDALLDRVVGIDADTVRIDVHWDWLEWTGPGVDQWDPDQLARLDAFVDAAQQRHVHVLAVVMDTPCWASSDPSKVCDPAYTRYNWREPPTNSADYAAFLRRLVHRYRGRIQAWEIWNEPNLPLFWTHPDPVAYTRLVQAAYPAIKSSDPTALVLAGALAPIEAGGPGISTADFLDAMYRAGARGSFDALSIHPYTGLRPPTADDPNAPAHSFVQTVPALHQEMLRAGDDHPIWITEAGWPTTLACDSCAGNGSGIDEAVQAADLREEIHLIRSWDYVQGFLWYELVDRGGATATSPEDHFGLLRHDLSPKPAADAFRASVDR